MTFLLCILFALCKAVSGSVTSEDKCIGDNRGDQLYLWEIKKSAESEASYLFGTIHVPYTLVPLPWQVKEAFKKVDNLYKEIVNNDSVTCSGGMFSDLFKTNKIPYSERRKLRREVVDYLDTLQQMVSSWFSDEDQKAAARRLIMSASPDLYLKSFDVFTISTTITMLSSELVLPQLAAGHDLLDQHLEAVARRSGMFVDGVEAWSSHCPGEITASLSPAAQVHLLNSTLDDLKNGFNSDTDDLINDYNCLTVDENPFTDTKYMENPEAVELGNWFNKKLLIERNKKMAEKIDEIMSRPDAGSNMFAFGINHFIGTHDSVTRYLRDKNYIVTRVNIKDDLDKNGSDQGIISHSQPPAEENSGTIVLVTFLTFFILIFSFLQHHRFIIIIIPRM